MREMAISICLIERGNNYILQLREGEGLNGGIGLVGCFGGSIEPKKDKSAQQAALREVTEETSLTPDLDDIERLGKVEVISDRDSQKVRVKADVFRLIIGADVEVIPAEGKIVELPMGDVINNMNTMTPATRAMFNELILGDN